MNDIREPVVESLARMIAYSIWDIVDGYQKVKGPVHTKELRSAIDQVHTKWGIILNGQEAKDGESTGV